MEVIEALFSRRSIRKYTGEPVPDKLITRMVEAAMFAPSANNTQPWQFIVTRDKNVFKQFVAIHPHANMLLEADCGIIVLRDLSRQTNDGYGVTDCAAATQNLLLAAHGLGLGACWIGTYPRIARIEYFAREFGLPENLEPFAVVSVGWPDIEPKQPDRYDPDRVFWR